MNTKPILYLVIIVLLLTLRGNALHAQQFFEPTSGPPGSSLFIGLFPGNDGTFFATDNTDGGSIFRSTDNGHTWQLTNRRDMTFGQGRIQSMLARPNGVVLAVYSTFTNVRSSDNWHSRLYRSTSNGDSTSWQWITELDSVGRVTTLLPGNGTTIVATADSGIYRSTDDGLTWLRVLERQGRAVNGAVSRGGMMYVIMFTDTNHGDRAWRSASGANWTRYGDTLPVSIGDGFPSTIGGVGSPGDEAVVSHGGSLLVPSWHPKYGNGVYRLDSGANPNPQWAQSSDGLPSTTEVRRLAVGSDGTIYAATASGLYRSTDDGHQWSATSFPSSGPIVVSGSTVLVGQYRSDDSGATFVLAGDGINHSNSNTMAVTGRKTLLTNAGELLYRSTDSGAIWTLITLQITKNSIFSDIVVGSSGAILAGTQSKLVGGKSGGLIYRSIDDGLTWKSVTTGLVATEIFDIEASKGLWFAATDSGMYRSTNDGDGWTAINTGLPTLDMFRVRVAPNGTVLASTTTGAGDLGAWRSIDNGDHWLNANNGNNSAAIRTLLAAPDGTLYMAANVGKVFYRSTNNGTSWDDISTPLPPESVLARIWAGNVDSHGTIFLSVITQGTLRNITIRSTDKGASWQQLDSISFNNSAFDPDGRMYLATGGYGVWRSIIPLVQAVPQLIFPPDAAADQPTAITLHWQGVTGAISYQLQIATDPTFASGIAFDQAGISDTFKLVNGLSTKTIYYWHVKAQGTNGSSLWSVEWRFTTNSGAPGVADLASPGNGNSNLDTVLLLQWHAVPEATSHRLQVGVDSTFASGIRVDQAGIADTSYQVIGLARSTRYYWRVEADNIVGPGAWSSVWNFRTAVPSSVDGQSENVRSDYSLETIINPMSSATTIRFTLPRSGMVRLTLYDALGREVRVLASGEQEAGEHSVMLDASGLASGIYYVQMSLNGTSITHPVTVMH